MAEFHLRLDDRLEERLRRASERVSLTMSEIVRRGLVSELDRLSQIGSDELFPIAGLLPSAARLRRESHELYERLRRALDRISEQNGEKDAKRRNYRESLSSGPPEID